MLNKYLVKKCLLFILESWGTTYKFIMSHYKANTRYCQELMGKENHRFSWA